MAETLHAHMAQTIQQEYDDPKDAGTQTLAADMTGSFFVSFLKVVSH